MTTDLSLGQLKLIGVQHPEAADDWRSTLAAGPAAAVLPTGPTDPTGATSDPFIFSRFFDLDPELTAELDRRTGSSPDGVHTVLAAVLLLMLRRYGGSLGADEATVAQPVPTTDTDPVNELLLLRCPVELADTVRDLILRTRTTVLNALRNRHFPLAVLADELGLDPSAPAEVGIELAGLHRPDGLRGLPLVFAFERRESALRMEIRYRVDRYQDAMVDRFAGHYLLLLDQALQDADRAIGDLTLMTATDADWLERVNDTDRPFDTEVRLDQVFAAQVARRPEAVALVGDDLNWTYLDLDRRANQLARTLRARGVGRDDVVAVLAERSAEMMVAILAVLKAGGAYLPIDPSYPAARIGYVLQDSAAKLVLAQPKFVPAGTEVSVFDLTDPNGYDDCGDPLAPIGGPEDLAYVIYTSGSTGNPKGVMVEHRSVINRISWMQNAYPITDRDVILQKTPIAFDVSVWELFWWSFVGARVCLLEPGGEKNPENIVAAIERHGVSTMHFVPSMLSVFLEFTELTRAQPRLGSLRQVFASGEALGIHTVRYFDRLLADRHTQLINLYGPTEATVDVSHQLCDGTADRVPIGKPIDNIRLYVVDHQLRPLPAGMPGELCIAGVGLARGYLHRTDLTLRRFVRHPFEAEQRVYRTGDLARWLPDGSIEYLGRLDHQVKIRGYRIELGEIEERLRAHPAVTETVVTARDGVGGDRYLCGYVITGGAEVTRAELRAFLGETLPDYMIPAKLVALAQFPLSANGKLDRAALPEPATTPVDDRRPLTVGDQDDQQEREYQEPQTEVERGLAAIWADVLGLERVGINDSFFALGGNSIHFVSVLARARELGVRITFQQLFAHPSIAALVRSLETTGSGSVSQDDKSSFEAFELVGEADRERLPAGAQDAYPLAQLQEGLIYQSEISQSTAQYHDVMSYLISSDFDGPAFTEAVRLLVERNPVLRTSYHLTGYRESLQVVHEQVPLPLAVVDLRGLAPDHQEEWHADWVTEVQTRRFRWDQPTLVRLQVQILRDDLYRYSIDLHNSALDGWSINLLHTKLFDLYQRLREGRPVPDPDPADHMRNLVGLEQRSLKTPVERRFWADVLHEAPATRVPGKLPVGAAEYEVRMHDVQIPAELSDQLLELARRNDVPVKTVLLAAHVAALAELTAQTDVVTGYEQSGRPELEGAQDALGMFLNTVPLRLHLDRGSWGDLIRQVHTSEVELLPHRRYPMAAMKRDLGLREPLFESVFNYTHFYPLKQLRQGAAFTLLDVRAWAETEFVIRAEFSRHFFTDQVGLYLQYHANVFDAERMIEIGDCYLRALQAMVADPAALRPVPSRPGPADRLVGTDSAGTGAVGVGSIGSGSISLGSISGSLMDGVGQAGATPRSDKVEAEWSAARERIAAAWSRVLGVDAQRIADQDDFFALGGHSLAALRAVMQLDGLISLGDLTLHSRLGALTTAAVTKATGVRKLLRTLSSSPASSGMRGHLVCVPYAAGSALGYRPLARELAAIDPSITVHSVELPGHEAGVDEEFEGVRETATRLAEELLKLPAGPIVLWSHCGGASVAVHTAGLLEAAGADLRHLLIAAKLLPTEEEMTGAIAELGRSTNADVIRWMVEESGYTELSASEVAAPEVTSDPEPIGTSLARAFRHDVVGGHRYFLDVCARPQEYALSVPVSFVAATDDPLMGDYRQTHHRWRLIADDLRLMEIDGGGHYFARTRAADCAALVARVFTSLEGNQ